LAITVLLAGASFTGANYSAAQTEPPSPDAQAQDSEHQVFPPERMADEADFSSADIPLIEYVVPSGANAISCQIDMAFVADGSGSISNADFTRIKQFTKAFVANIGVGAQGARVALVQFSSQGTGRVEQSLTDDVVAFNAAVDRMLKLGGNTDIQEGIQLGSQELRLRGRADVPKVIVVLTDGEHNQSGSPVAEANLFKQSEGFVFAIAVGSFVDRNELIGIASQPYSRYLYSVTDANSLTAIQNSLSENVCTCRETQKAGERVTRVSDGMCLRVYDNRIYIGSANLANANVNLKVLHRITDQGKSLFDKKTVRDHVESDPSLSQLVCLPSGVISGLPSPICVLSPTRFYFAINGTAHKALLQNPDTPSPDSILSLGGTLYTTDRTGVPDKPRASFLTFSGASAVIHRSYTPTIGPAPPPSFAVPEDLAADHSTAQSYVLAATQSAQFAVGYRKSFLDLSSTPPLEGDINDSDGLDTLTAIAVSADGKTVFMAAAEKNVGPQALAAKLKSLGAQRAILLDGGGSTQFASFRENMSAFYALSPLTGFVRPVSTAIAAYSISATAASSVTVTSASSVLAVAPNTFLDVRGSRLTANSVITQVPVTLSSAPASLAQMTVESGSLRGHGAMQIGATTAYSLPAPAQPLRAARAAYVTYAQDRNGMLTQPQASYVMTATYDLIDFAPGTLASMLGLYFWDGSKWVREPTSRVNYTARAVVARPKQFGIWALFADPRVYVPLVKR
jgi:hypothetical protein